MSAEGPHIYSLCLILSHSGHILFQFESRKYISLLKSHLHGQRDTVTLTTCEHWVCGTHPKIFIEAHGVCVVHPVIPPHFHFSISGSQNGSREFLCKYRCCRKKRWRKTAIVAHCQKGRHWEPSSLILFVY